MKTTTIAKEVEQKKIDLAKDLLDVKDKWPYSEKAYWCASNGYNTDSVTKGYFNGKTVGSIPVAEKILAAIQEYMKQEAA